MADSQAVQQASARLPGHITTALRDLRPTLGPLLPQDITEEQFRAALYLELSGRPSLHDCTPESLRACAVKAATYGLLPGRDCHFLPFRNRGRKEATYVPNYFGIILALERSGKVRRAFAHAVCEGDHWAFDMFAERPQHTPAVALGKKPGKTLFYYGAIMFHDSTCAFEILTLEDLEALKKCSPAGEQSVWLTHHDAMCRKSALKRVAKYVRLTPKMQELLAEEEAMPVNEERHQANITDLFGDAAAPALTTHAATPPNEGQTYSQKVSQILDTIDRVVISYGGEPDDYWAAQTKRFGGHDPRATASPEALNALLKEAVAVAATLEDKRQERAQEAATLRDDANDDDSISY